MAQLTLPTFQPLEPFVSAKEASQFVRLHPVTLQRLAREGTLPAHPVGDGQRRRWRFLLSELGQWLQARDRGTAGKSA
jgi:excisionase family DNA binding protein